MLRVRHCYRIGIGRCRVVYALCTLHRAEHGACTRAAHTPLLALGLSSTSAAQRAAAECVRLVCPPGRVPQMEDERVLVERGRSPSRLGNFRPTTPQTTPNTKRRAMRRAVRASSLSLRAVSGRGSAFCVWDRTALRAEVQVAEGLRAAKRLLSTARLRRPVPPRTTDPAASCVAVEARRLLTPLQG